MPASTSEKTVYLHIGTGKTGTSAIQNFLYGNRLALAAAHDLDYPECGLLHEENFGEPLHAHNKLVGWLREGQAVALQEVADAVCESRCRKVVLSSENLYHHLSLPEIGALRSLLAPHRVVVIAYVRRQDEYIESAWKQQAKIGAMRLPFSMFVERHTQSKYLSETHANYLRMLEPWREAFGRENIRLRIFSRSEFAGDSLLNDFLLTCDAASAAAAQLPASSIVNASVPIELADLNRRALVARLLAPEDMPAFTAFLQALDACNDGTLLGEQDRAAVLENYAACNRELFDTYLGGRFPDSFRADYGTPQAPIPPGILNAAALRCLVAAFRLGEEHSITNR